VYLITAVSAVCRKLRSNASKKWSRYFVVGRKTSDNFLSQLSLYSIIKLTKSPLS
jgi:hypothetical protein